METGAPLVVVDLLLEVERQEGGIPGALAVAFEDLDSLLPAIANKEVVFYCSCPDELSSVRAALRLKAARHHTFTRCWADSPPGVTSAFRSILR